MHKLLFCTEDWGLATIDPYSCSRRRDTKPMFIRYAKESRIRLLQQCPDQCFTHADPAVRRFNLRKEQSMRLELNAATEIRCEQGSLWLTIDGDLNDYMLTTGQAAIVRDLRPIHFVVAFKDSVLSLTDLSDLKFIREPLTRRMHRKFRSWLKQSPQQESPSGDKHQVQGGSLRGD